MSFSDIPFRVGDHVVAYLRDSGGDNQELSTQQQEAQLRAWCDQNGLILSHLFIDAARPGSSTEKRDQFQEMIDHFHKPGCSDRGLLVWSMSRFARNELDASYYKADLRRRHFVVWSITENIPDSPEGRLIEHAFDLANEKHLEKASRDITRGLAYNFQQFGAVPGTPPFGFKVVKKVVGVRRDNTPHTVNTWQIDPESTPIVQAAFKMRSEGYSIAAIHERYHLFKNRSSYSTFFRNPLYIGELTYGGIKKSDYVQPIMDREIWEKVQAINIENRKENSPTANGHSRINPRRNGGNFLLSGIAYCSRCGSILTGKVVQFNKEDKPFGYYLCTGHSAGMDCNAPRIPQQALEESVIDEVTNYVVDPSMLSLRERNRELSTATYVEELHASIRKLTREQSEIKRRQANLINRIADDPDAPASILQSIRNTEMEIRAKQEEIDRLSSQLNYSNVRARTPIEIQELSKQLLALISSNDITKRRTIVRLLVHRILAERTQNLVRGLVYFYDEPVPTASKEDLPPDPKIFMPT